MRIDGRAFLRRMAHPSAVGLVVAIADGPLAGVGRDNINKSPRVSGFTLTAAERADLVAFLTSLTDEALLTDPQGANPWSVAGATR